MFYCSCANSINPIWHRMLHVATVGVK